MTVRDIMVLFVQFSDLPDSQKESFLRQHPGVLDVGIIDWALNASRLRGQMGEPEAKRRYANAALYIATKMGDT